MGNQLDRRSDAGGTTRRRRGAVRLSDFLSRLDPATRALVGDMVQTLASERPDLLAVVLFGSVARGEERPLDDPAPSDVDLLVVLDTEDEGAPMREVRTLFGILGRAYDRHLDAPRDVKVQFASRDLREWDATFVENVARAGRVLWSKGALPVALRPSSRADMALIAPTHAPIPGAEGGGAPGSSSAHG